MCDATATIPAPAQVTKSALQRRGVKFDPDGAYADKAFSTPEETEEVTLTCDRSHNSEAHHHDPVRGDWSMAGVRMAVSG